MPILDQAKKAMRKDTRRRVLNDARRRKFRESVKDVREEAKTAKPAELAKLLSTAYQALDKAAKRGVIKKGAADRKKSRLAQLVKKSAAK